MKRFKHINGLMLSLFLGIALVLFLLLNNAGHRKDCLQSHQKDGTAIASIHDSSLEINSSALDQAESIIAPSQPQYHEIKGELKKGEGLDDSLKRLDVPGKIRSEIIRTLSGTLDFKRLRPKDCYSVTLDKNGELVRCIYESGPLNIYKVTKTDDGYAAEKLLVPLEVRTHKLTGVIDSSIFAAFIEQGEEAKLIHAFADIFSSKIDFNTETRQGDRFGLVFEKYYKDDEFVGYGKILVALYEQTKHMWEGYYYSSDKTPSGHFDEKGEELGTSFLRSPIPFGRVTSRFSYRRKHPILKVTRPHLGVDLAAPTGTPVLAVSDGKVIFRGWKGGFGRQVIIRHAGEYRTYYGHLSKFKKGLKVGSRVKQKDVIGYVGSSGLSSGPHLDYRISYKSVFKNPFSLKFKPKSILAGKELESFSNKRKDLAQLMHFSVEQQVLHVKKVVLGTDKGISFL